jgi:hypothetical protein
MSLIPAIYMSLYYAICSAIPATFYTTNIVAIFPTHHITHDAANSRTIFSAIGQTIF